MPIEQKIPPPIPYRCKQENRLNPRFNLIDKIIDALLTQKIITLSGYDNIPLGIKMLTIFNKQKIIAIINDLMSYI